ncbi:SDR family NAD(P)-dependent oxidoreductase [Plantactinospora soyae]|uniref:3-oxoacyl-[acyl-carrier protein] reductase n=1 Tax=Plantactinospora soyae TaxID=1544732 RepID=A0A927R044_9ACTN|nr:SDR family oxidoreductase [Plantactinospora soyae]MBE1489782.1 3-oxoacyl-[acyl-carrier protein] reductase [Plantactinospora soyae]
MSGASRDGSGVGRDEAERGGRGNGVADRLCGRVAVVTGAAGGLGRAIARRLLDEGALVAGLDVLPVEETTRAVGAGEPAAADATAPAFRAWRCDVTDPDAVAEVVAAVAAGLGPVDVLVNNAGLLSGRAGMAGTTSAQMLRYFEVNAVGPLLMVQACLDHLRASPHRGRVVNVASRTFFTGSPGQLAYVASKGALVGMTRVLARELGADRITVNAAVPAQVETPGTAQHSTAEVFEATMRQQAIQEYVTPERFAGLVAYLASDDAALMTGQTLVYDGGGLLR